MVMISEISDDSVGSLNGLGQMTQRPGAAAQAKTAALIGTGLRPPPSLTESERTQYATPPPGEMTVDGGGSQMVPAGGQPSSFMQQGGSFLDNLMSAVKANPIMFAAGAAVLVIGVVFGLPRLRTFMASRNAAMGPVQTMGLGEGPKRKKRKSQKFYVHFGGDGSSMSTVSFKSKAAAEKAVREAKAAGEPARLQKA